MYRKRWIFTARNEHFTGDHVAISFGGEIGDGHVLLLVRGENGNGDGIYVWHRTCSYLYIWMDMCMDIYMQVLKCFVWCDDSHNCTFTVFTVGRGRLYAGRFWSHCSNLRTRFLTGKCTENTCRMHVCADSMSTYNACVEIRDYLFFHFWIDIFYISLSESLLLRISQQWRIPKTHACWHSFDPPFHTAILKLLHQACTHFEWAHILVFRAIGWRWQRCRISAGLSIFSQGHSIVHPNTNHCFISSPCHAICDVTTSSIEPHCVHHESHQICFKTRLHIQSTLFVKYQHGRFRSWQDESYQQFIHSRQ